MEFIYKHADWSNINVLERNRLPMRPFYCGYQTVKEARIGMKSGKYRLLLNEVEVAGFESPFWLWIEYVKGVVILPRTMRAGMAVE